MAAVSGSLFGANDEKDENSPSAGEPDAEPSKETKQSGEEASQSDVSSSKPYKSARKLPKAAKDPVLIEKSNLVNISKLVVKELIETSQKYGRMLDSDHLPLQHFFIVLEHVLRHGLKPKKGLLGPKKELWDILQLVEKFASEAQDITTSVRDLPTVSTHMGRARAWLRLALMQKKLSDYLKVLIDRKETVLADYFEPDALMMSDEAFIILGLLVGLNVIDCNLCVKEEDLDCQQGVIDFSLYLRNSHHYYHSGDSVLDPDNMTTVLDQKNYIEELNRHLNATVANLEAKVESLQTTNALMKEDLDISRNNILLLTEENAELKRQIVGKYLNRGDESKPSQERGSSGESGEDSRSSDGKRPSETATEIDDIRKQLDAERRKRTEVEKELKLQVSMKSEMEVAMKLLEKDIRDKENTILMLSRQLDEIKLINLELFKKLQDCESSLKQKTELVTKLEAKTALVTETFQKLEEKHEKLEREKLTAEELKRNLSQKLAEKETLASSTEGDLKMEREWRTSLQDSMVKDRNKISQLNQELSSLRAKAAEYEALKAEHEKLKEHCSQQELTLEELGVQLSVSRLKVADLEEEARIKTESQWASDKEAQSCKTCSKEFNLTRRKHHCRNCGEIFCSACSDNLAMLPSSAKPVRVCDECHVYLISRTSVS